MHATTFEQSTTNRLDQLGAELRVAVSQTSGSDMAAWAKRSAVRIPASIGRRAWRLGDLTFRLVKTIVNETQGAFRAGMRGELNAHASDRAAAAGRATREACAQAGVLAIHVGRLARELPTRPEVVAPELFSLGLGLLAGSGGLDGDGGIPDLDLALGIGFHRSIVTHSIIAGAIAESVIAAVLDLVLVVHTHLPKAHDRLWDTLMHIALRCGANLRIGIDAGLALHLLVDGTVDGMTPYKDLPVTLPLEAHRALLLGNGTVEALMAIDGGSMLSGRRR